MLKLMVILLELAGVLACLLLALAVLFALVSFIAGVRRSIKSARALEKVKQEAYEMFEAASRFEEPDLEKYVSDSVDEFQTTLLGHPFNMKGPLDEDRNTGTES